MQQLTALALFKANISLFRMTNQLTLARLGHVLLTVWGSDQLLRVSGLETRRDETNEIQNKLFHRFVLKTLQRIRKHELPVLAPPLTEDQHVSTTDAIFGKNHFLTVQRPNDESMDPEHERSSKEKPARRQKNLRPKARRRDATSSVDSTNIQDASSDQTEMR